MSDIGLYKVSKENQSLFINQEEIAGIQNIQINSENGIQNISHLQQSEQIYSILGPRGGSMSVDSLLITNDQWVDRTGESGFNGYIINDKPSITNNVSFSSGFLTSYSCSCSIGQIPQISANIEILGNVGTLTTSDPGQINTDLTAISAQTIAHDDPTLKVALPNKMSITTADYSSNRLTNFEVNINIKRSPVYAMGSGLPIHVGINYPVQVSCNLKYEIDTYTANRSKDYICDPKPDNITVILNDKNDAEILTFKFDNMQLQSESFDVSNSSNTTVNAVYIANYYRNAS